MTNGENVRTMSDEELARIIYVGRGNACATISTNDCIKKMNCHQCLEEWLKRERDG